MSEKIQLAFYLTNEDFRAVQAFRYHGKKLNALQRMLLYVGNVWASRRRKSQVSDETKYVFTESGLKLTYQGEENRAAWELFSEILEYESGYLFISAGRQIEIVIPKRVFPDQTVESRFRNLVRLKLGFNAKLRILQ